MNATESHRHEAESALAARQYERAAQAYRAWLRSPGDGRAADWFNLAYALRRAGEPEGALAAYAQALSRGIDQPEEARLNRAAILSEVFNRDAEAEAELRQALAERPGWPPALLNLGNLLEERGDRDGAAACYRQLADAPSAQADPAAAAEALARLVQLAPPADAASPLLQRLRDAIARDDGAADPEGAANLRFALGRALDGLGLHDEAMSAWHDANRLAARSGHRYDPARASAAVDALLRACTALPPEGVAAGAADDGPQALFICGQYRSGSTLLEQVLAAHPAVEAGGELEIVPRWLSRELAPFPAALAGLDAAGAARLAAAYRSEQRRRVPHGPLTRYLTDKRPDNHLLVGVIQRVLPGSPVVHTARHPLDTAVSIYSQHLAQGRLPYASDLFAIGHQLGLSRRVLEAWRERFGGAIHDFDYDAFVRAPRATLEPLLAFLGLPWDDALLRFHERRGSVRTASVWQVRQPLHQGSSGRWRRYERHLGPLFDGMRAAGMEPPR